MLSSDGSLTSDSSFRSTADSAYSTLPKRWRSQEDNYDLPDDSVLPELYQLQLTQSSVLLREELEVEPILQYLYSDHILSQSEYERVRHKSIRSEKATAMVDIMRRKCKGQFEAFLNGLLETNQAHLAEAIEKSGWRLSQSFRDVLWALDRHQLDHLVKSLSQDADNKFAKTEKLFTMARYSSKDFQVILNSLKTAYSARIKITFECSDICRALFEHYCSSLDPPSTLVTALEDRLNQERISLLRVRLGSIEFTVLCRSQEDVNKLNQLQETGELLDWIRQDCKRVTGDVHGMSLTLNIPKYRDHQDEDTVSESDRIYENLQEKTSVFEENLRLESLLDRLVEAGVITEMILERIRRHSSRETQALLLLQEFSDGGQIFLEDFEEALREDGQAHLANLLVQRCDAKVMSLQMKNAISENRMTLIDHLNVDDDLDRLEKLEIITLMQHRILSEKSSADRVTEFMSILLCRPGQAFESLLVFLTGSNRQHLANLLEERLHQTSGSDCRLTETQRKHLLYLADKRDITAQVPVGDVISSLLQVNLLPAGAVGKFMTENYRDEGHKFRSFIKLLLKARVGQKVYDFVVSYLEEVTGKIHPMSVARLKGVYGCSEVDEDAMYAIYESETDLKYHEMRKTKPKQRILPAHHSQLKSGLLEHNLDYFQVERGCLEFHIPLHTPQDLENLTRLVRQKEIHVWLRQDYRDVVGVTPALQLCLIPPVFSDSSKQKVNVTEHLASAASDQSVCINMDMCSLSPRSEITPTASEVTSQVDHAPTYVPVSSKYPGLFKETGDMSPHRSSMVSLTLGELRPYIGGINTYTLQQKQPAVHIPNIDLKTESLSPYMNWRPAVDSTSMSNEKTQTVSSYLELLPDEGYQTLNDAVAEPFGGEELDQTDAITNNDTCEEEQGSYHEYVIVRPKVYIPIEPMEKLPSVYCKPISIECLTDRLTCDNKQKSFRKYLLLLAIISTMLISTGLLVWFVHRSSIGAGNKTEVYTPRMTTPDVDNLKSTLWQSFKEEVVIPSATADKQPAITENPPTATYKPSVTTDKLTTTTDKPSVTTYNPPITTDNPPTTADKLTTTTYKPTLTTYKPSVTTDKLSVTTYNPPPTTDIPPTTADKPTATTDKPSVTTDKPSATTDTSTTNTDKPSVTTEKPSVTTYNPPTTTDNPPTTAGKSTATTDKPSQSADESTTSRDNPPITIDKLSATTEKTNHSISKTTINTENVYLTPYDITKGDSLLTKGVSPPTKPHTFPTRKNSLSIRDIWISTTAMKN